MKRLFVLILTIAATGKFTQAQNIGIGITTPTEKLHVSGNVKADTVKPNALKIITNAGNGKVLTSDAAGNGTWQLATATVNTNTGGGSGFGSWGDCSTNSISAYEPITDTAGKTSDFFGNAVVISDNFAIIGAPQQGGKGYANVYQFNGSNWILTQKLTDPTGSVGDVFGGNVAISGNFAIVGSALATVGNNVAQGAVCIFQFNGSSWVFKQKIVDPAGAANDIFGASFAISGNNIIVGSPLDDVGTAVDQGSASIFRNNGTSWVFVQKLTDLTGVANDKFGAVSISGNFAIVAASQDDVNGNTDQGSANIYQFNGTTWTQIKKLTDPNGTASDLYGSSVAISGNFAIIGAPGIGNGHPCAAHTYQNVGGDWVLMEKITQPAGTLESQFGVNVCLSGIYAMISDPSPSINSAGVTSIYTRVGPQWHKVQTVKDPHGRAGDRFGAPVSIDEAGKRFLVGACSYAFSIGKAVFGKVN